MESSIDQQGQDAPPGNGEASGPQEEGSDSTFSPLGSGSRHMSFFPSVAAAARKKFPFRSMTLGYPGVRDDDFDDDRRNSTAVDFRQEIKNVKKTFKDEVKEARKGKDGDFLLEMTLTRTLSVMPSRKDMKEVVSGFNEMTMSIRRRFSTVGGVELAPDNKDRVEKESTTSMAETEVASSVADDEESPLIKKGEDGAVAKKKHRKIPMHAYVTLFTAVTALSSIGPFLDRLDGVSPPLRIVWRQQGTALVLWPFALRSILVDGPPRLSVAQWCTFVLASFSYCVLTVAFSVSVDYTTINDAAILTNSQSLLVVIAKLLVGSKVVCLEWSGVLIAFMGTVMCSRDSADAVQTMTWEQDDHNPWVSVYGDALAFLSGIGGLGYIILGKSLRDHVEVYVFMTLNMFLGSHMILFYMWLTGDAVTFDRHIDHGVYGWANWDIDRLPVEFAVVFICNVCGTMGYVRAFKYFSSVIITVAALLEPVIATLLAILLNVGVMPGWLGCIGNIVVIVGTLMVIYPSAVEEEEEEEEKEKEQQ